MSEPVSQRTLCSVRLHRTGLWLASAPLAEAAARADPAVSAFAQSQPWVPARREAFVAGRAVAAGALQALGVSAAVGRRADGMPLWPEDVVGSIAHSAALAVAVAGSTAHWLALGVDVEPDQPLPADTAATILRPEDRGSLADAFGGASAQCERLVFCAKECVHKALHPWRDAWLEFDEVRTVWQADHDLQAGRWQALPVSDAAVRAFGTTPLQGEWWRQGGALWALLAVSR